MTDVALTSASTYAQVRVREPLGDRTLGETSTIGGEGADIVVPGIDAGPAVQIQRQNGAWFFARLSDTRLRFNGRLLKSPRDLHRHDVLAVGNSQVIVTDVSRTLLRLEVCHLVGNTTVSPGSAIAALEPGGGDEDLLIQALPPKPQQSVDSPGSPSGAATPGSGQAGRRRRIAAASAASLSLLVILLLTQLTPVTLDVEPSDARVHALGAFSFRSGSNLYLFSGRHSIRGEHVGYAAAQVQVTVRRGGPGPVARLHLAKLPGTLKIDTANIAADISVDGIETGRAPGVVTLSAGNHTITLRAPHYVDYIASVSIEGAGVRQSMKASLQPSWGTLQISSIPAGAHVSVDDVDSGVTPLVVGAPSGVRQIRISALNQKSWESSVVLKAGEALNVGPITLGQPDAHLVLRSIPSGGEVMIGGVHRGATPLEIDLPAGMQHELVVNVAGYAPWTRTVFAEAGKRVIVDAKLETIGALVTVQGEPQGAQLYIDGIESGRTPQSFTLSAVEHHIEVRKDGWATYTAKVTPAQGLDRTLQYRLLPSQAVAQTAATLYTQTGYRLRLLPAGPNFKRPLYFGVEEISNGQFRRFRAGHTSGSPNPRFLNRDDEPVTRVTWSDAVEYCNWLSERDNLPPAYERKGDLFVLKKPVTIGYRLPTRAEWDYAVGGSGGKQNDRSANGSEWIGEDSSAVLNSAAGENGATDAIGFRVVRYAE